MTAKRLVKTAREIARARGLLLQITGVTVAGFPHRHSPGGVPFCAGLIVSRLASILGDRGERLLLRDGAQVAAGLAAAGQSRSLEVLTSSEHGRFLESIGFAEDLKFVSRVDQYPIAPVFDGERVIRGRSYA